MLLSEFSITYTFKVVNMGFTADLPGEYLIELIVTDNKGLYSSSPLSLLQRAIADAESPSPDVYYLADDRVR